MKRGIMIAAVFLFGSCDRERIAGGSTSETSNGLMVRVMDEQGRPAARVRVRIRPSEFLAGSSPATDDPNRAILDTATDDSGWVKISHRIGHVRLEAFASMNAAQAHGDSGQSVVELKLAANTKVTGRVATEPGEGRARIQVRGMEHAIWTNSDGSFLLDSLPSGSVRLRAWIPGSGKSIEASIPTVPAATSNAGTLVPRYDPDRSTDSIRVYLNTKTGNVVTTTRLDSVPILVMLDGNDFPAKAKNDGSDLRVHDSTGRPLPFSKALWSPETRQAHLWVRVNSVRPADSSQWFKIRWGDPTASDASRPWTVFSAANGWAGVWDLQRNYLDRAGRWRVADASSWTDDGLLTGTPTSDPVEGLRFLRGGKDGLAMSGIGANLAGNFTVLIRSRPDHPGSILLGRGDSAWDHGMKEFFLGAQGSTKITRKPGWYPSFMGWADTAYNVYSVSNHPVDSSAWTFLVARHAVGAGDSGAVDWFVDGTKTTTTATQTTFYEKDRNKDSLVVGYRHGYGSRFSGSMAEIWILSRAVGDDWIKLQAECRKDGGGTLVRLRR